MEKILRLWAGYVLISVEGEQTERFLNLCRSRGICIRNLSCPDDRHLTGIISVRHFFLLRPIRSKTRVHIRILEKHGMPFFFFRSKKRKAFFLGILLCFCLMVTLSCHIWNIHIEGNIRNSTPEILKFLEEQGIVHGIARRKVNCSQIAAAVRRQYPEITWVSARIEGTRLILTIQEGVQQDTAEEESSPCSLASELDGTIVKIITRTGFPIVKEGDEIKKGDLLVAGRLELKNDSQEIFRYEYVHADADIYVRHKLSYYYEFPMEYEAEVSQGTQKKGGYLKLGNWYLELSTKLPEGWRKTTEEFPLRITENFKLPVSFGRISMEQYKRVQSIYTKEQAKTKAWKHLQLYEEKLIQKGVQISANNVKIETNHNSCVSRGSLEVIEKTGKEIPVEILEQPTERTSENDEQYH